MAKEQNFQKTNYNKNYHLYSGKPLFKSEHSKKTDKELEEKRIKEKMKLKEAHSHEKHWEAKYGKKPLDIQLAQKYTTKSQVVRKEEQDLQDLFDAVVLEIKERQQHLRDLEKIKHPDKVSLTEPSEKGAALQLPAWGGSSTCYPPEGWVG